eukprot:938456-Pleurochrysis_carterae.AAC.2
MRAPRGRKAHKPECGVAFLEPRRQRTRKLKHTHVSSRVTVRFQNDKACTEYCEIRYVVCYYAFRHTEGTTLAGLIHTPACASTQDYAPPPPPIRHARLVRSNIWNDITS